MGDFSEYEKMPGNSKKLKLDESDFSKMNKLKWVVTEKIHGANFSFVYENYHLKFVKRRAYLNWTDDFFGFQSVVNKLEDKMLRLFERFKSGNGRKKNTPFTESYSAAHIRILTLLP